MHAKIFFTFTSLLFLTTKGSRDDHGPQIFTGSIPLPPLPSPSPQIASPSTHPNFQTKEVIVYLTPTQIKALQSGQGVLEPVLDTQSQQQNEKQIPQLPQIPQHDYDNDEEFKKELERQKAYIETHSDIDEAISTIQNQREKTPPPVKEPSREKPQEETSKFSWYPQQENQYYNPSIEKASPTTLKPDTYNPSTEQPGNSKWIAPNTEDLGTLIPKSYNYFSVYNEKKGDNINIKIFHPAPKDTKDLDAQKYAPLIKKYKLLPYEYSKKLSDWQPFESSEAQKNEGKLKNLYTPPQLEEQSQYQKYGQDNSDDNESNEEALKQKYASRYNDQKQAIEIQNLLKKQKAAAQIEAIAKAPPLEVHREVSITKQKPVQVIEHVQVPVPQPYIVRVPEPFEVKVPQPYPVPLEIIRHVPVEVIKTEKIEVEKPVPYEVEKRVPVPVTKNIYVKVDRPYFVDKVVPVEIRKEVPVPISIRKPQKLTILRHVWESN